MARNDSSRRGGLPVTRITRIPRLAKRKRDSHKGSYGRVLVIGGSLGMAGAPALVGLSALRAGAGLVTIATPACVQGVVATLCPCATTIGLPGNADGQVDPAGARRMLSERGLMTDTSIRPDVVVVGPGLGRGTKEENAGLWSILADFREAGVPIVADADALNRLVAGDADAVNAWDQGRWGGMIVTPHPGELARLHGVGIERIQADREKCAVDTARRLSRDASERPAVVVLKGAGSIVTNGSSLYVNKTGNPGMATGGTGDVLSGVIGALVGQGLGLRDAAILGVHVHGLAGDLAARRLREVSLIATDLIDSLPEAFGRMAKAKRAR